MDIWRLRCIDYLVLLGASLIIKRVSENTLTANNDIICGRISGGLAIDDLKLILEVTVERIGERGHAFWWHMFKLCVILMRVIL